MLKNSRNYSELKDKLRGTFGNDLVDAILFGSSAKGKSKPGDIDLCVILRNPRSTHDIAQASDVLGNKIHLSALTVENFFTKFHSLSKSLLFEGISILDKRSLVDRFGLKSMVLYSYELKKLEASNKVRFVNLVRGKPGETGLIRQLEGEFVSQSTFLIPASVDEEMLEVLKQWGVSFTRRKLVLMN